MGLTASTRLRLQVNATRGNALRQRLNNVTYFTATCISTCSRSHAILQCRLGIEATICPVLPLTVKQAFQLLQER
jgi:hypothetical protein